VSCHPSIINGNAKIGVPDIAHEMESYSNCSSETILDASSRLPAVLLNMLYPCCINIYNLRTLSMFSSPNGKQVMELLQLLGPIFFAINAKVTCCSALTFKCTSFGVVPLVAHNIMMQI